MSLDSIINVTISRETKAVSQAGFGIPLILTAETPTAAYGTIEYVRYYSDITGVAADWSSSSLAYKAALAVFSQVQTPEQVGIGLRSAKVAQVDTVTPNVTVQAAVHYIETIDGVAYDFLSDTSPTAAEVVTGLAALINADANCNAHATGTTTLVLTAKVAGQGFAHSESTNLVSVETTANVGAATDLQRAFDSTNNWYAVISTDRTPADVMAIAGWIEAERRMFFTASADASDLTNGTSDIGSLLKAKNYSRTAVMYSADQGDFPEAAWAGLCLPFAPGSETWKFKNLAGIISDDALTQTQVNNIVAKSMNYYKTFAGVAITSEGVVASGEFIDVIRFIDWLHARMQERIYAALVNAPKIPYTDIGVAAIESLVRAQLEDAEAVGGITKDPKYTVTVPLVANINVSDRTARLLPDINFTAVLAGAIHSLKIDGVVTV